MRFLYSKLLRLRLIYLGLILVFLAKLLTDMDFLYSSKQHFGKHYLVYYGFCLIASIYTIIRRNLFMVRDFIEEELYLFKQSKEVLMLIKVFIQISIDEAKNFAKEKDAFTQIFEKTSEYVKDIYHKDLITEEILI